VVQPSQRQLSTPFKALLYGWLRATSTRLALIVDRAIEFDTVR
jgi:hypothetical protein